MLTAGTSPPEAPPLELAVQPSDAEIRAALPIVECYVAFLRWVTRVNEGTTGGAWSRQRAQAYQALSRWEILAPFLSQLRKGAVCARELADGIGELEPFRWSEAAEAYLWRVLEAAPRLANEPVMPRPRTWRALLRHLGYCAAAYRAGKAFSAAHPNLTRLIPDWTTRSGERWLPILHRAAVVTSYPLFDEFEVQRRSKSSGEGYDRSQAPQLYVCDATLYLHTAIKLTLDERAGVLTYEQAMARAGATAPAEMMHARTNAAATPTTPRLSIKTAVASPSDRPSHVSGKDRTVVESLGLATAGAPASPSKQGLQGAPPGGGESDPGHPRAALTSDTALPTPTTTALEEQRSSLADSYRAGGDVWRLRYEVITGVPPEPATIPEELRQLTFKLEQLDHRGAPRRPRVPTPAERDREWHRDVATLLRGWGAAIPDERRGEVDELLRQLVEWRSPNEAAVAVVELLRPTRREGGRAPPAPPHSRAPPETPATSPNMN